MAEYMAVGNFRDSATRPEIADAGNGDHINGFAPGEAFVTIDLLDDAEALKIKQEILGQLTNSRSGYLNTVENINKLRFRNTVEAASEEAFRAELESWLTPEQLAAASYMKERHPFTKLTLVGTPNILVNSAEVKTLFKAVNNQTPYWTDYDNPLYDHYTPEQLSGTNPGNLNAVQFSLFPNRLDPMLYGKVEQQLKMLIDAQQINPHIRTSSLLEDITYFATLLASDKEFPNNSLSTEETLMWHFDLPAIFIDDHLQAPAYLQPVSQITDGEAYLYENIIDQPENARHIIG